VKVTQALVPVLAIGYLLLALAVIGINVGSVPAAVALIFQSAAGIPPSWAT
jgi:AGCS family alanine or glycine:cation symporter